VRKHLSTRERGRLFTLHGGVCHFCSGKIQATEAWDISHDIPLELGGADDDANRKPAHRKCHRAHTAAVDQPAIAKSKRVRARHTGSKAPSQRGFRGWRRFNGEIVRRDP
jgi:5-methylcytosine-specific restriction protein A